MRHYIKRLLICIALLTANAVAWAESYVITNGTYFLYNKSGSIDATQNFDPNTCIWTCSGTTSGKLSNNGYYLYYSYSLSLSKTSSTDWTIDNSKVYYKRSSYYSSYYIYYSTNSWNSGWTVSSSSSSSCYAVDSTIVEKPVGKVTITPVTQTMDEGDKCNFTVESVSYTPAYNKYTFNNTSYYCTPKWENVSTTGPSVVTTASGYAWTTDASTDNLELTNDETATVTATYKTHLSEQADKKLTATVTIPQTGSFMTGDDKITASATLTLTKRAKPTLTLTLPSEVYVGETVDGSLTSTSDGDITYKVDGESYVTFTQDATDNKNFTVTGKTLPTDKTTKSESVTITATVAQTDDYLEGTVSKTISVRKHPTKITLAYDKSEITYSDNKEDYPKLTSCVVTDTQHPEEVISNPKINYSSSETFIHVDNENGTGAITSITQAGTAVITATYDGDGKYAAADQATFNITVNKAPTTVKFADNSFFVRFTEAGGTTFPTATLDPSSAGSVKYSYESCTPAGLVTVDESSGQITLNGDARDGSATIKASFEGDNRYEASEDTYTLTVSTRAIPTFDVTMENSLYVDNTHKITVNTNSNGAVTYSSSNTNVLTVDDSGNMTAKKEGTADVTVQMAGDNDYIPMEATFTVTVKRYPTKLTLGKLEKEYYTDHGDIALTVSLEETVNNQPVSGETGKYTYVSSNTSVLTVSQNASGDWVIKPVGAGIASVTVTFEGDDKYEGSHDSWQITVKRTAMPGDFIRIKNGDGYLSSSDGTSITTSATADASNIIYYGKDGDLLFYQCGRYINDATPTLADVVNKDGKGTAFTFTRSGDEYTISAGTSNLCGATDLTVEEVDCLPVTFKDAGYGYSTFYSPVNLRTPAGVIAYYATARNTDPDGKVDYIITLKEVSHGVMPANTPLVLKASDITSVQTYNFYIIDETSTLDDRWTGIEGTLPTINTSSVYSTDSKQCPYTLQPTASAQTVGFYPWKKDNHGTIEPFRCYIPGDNVKSASQAKGFRFVFDDGETTGIDAAPSSATIDDSTIYNLQGTAVGKDLQSLPAGVYIQGGKKVMKGW